MFIICLDIQVNSEIVPVMNMPIAQFGLWKVKVIERNAPGRLPGSPPAKWVRNNSGLFVFGNLKVT
jgi:hypothetical protein